MAAFLQPGFPPEIIDKSLKYLDPLILSDRQGLAKCLILSRTYHNIALPLLYETVVYTGRADDRSLDGGIFRPLVTFLQDHPLQAALIKNLFLSGYVVYRTLSSGNTVFSPTYLCILRDIIHHTPSLQCLGLHSLRILNLCQHPFHTPYDPPLYYLPSHTEHPRHIRHLLMHNVSLYTTQSQPASRSGAQDPRRCIHLMQLSHLQHLVAPDAITLDGVQRFTQEVWMVPWKHTALTLHLNFDDELHLNANSGVITQLATIRGLKDFQVWAVNAEVKHGVETILQRNGMTLEMLALCLGGTEAEWSYWHDIGLENCTSLSTLCLAFELYDLQDLASDRWDTLVHLLQRAPPDIQDLHIAFHPASLSMKYFCRHLGKQDWAKLLGVLQVRLQKLQTITLELIGVGNQCDPSSTEPAWKRYEGHTVQDMIAQSFRGNKWRLEFKAVETVADVFPYGSGRDFSPLRDLCDR